MSTSTEYATCERCGRTTESVRQSPRHDGKLLCTVCALEGVDTSDAGMGFSDNGSLQRDLERTRLTLQKRDETDAGPVSPSQVPKKRDGETGLFSTRLFQTDRFKPVSFLWSRRLVRGVLNVWVGDEGVGKGSLEAHLIAQATHGELEGQDKPAKVLWLGDEDSTQSVVGPRLQAAGVDWAQVAEVVGEDDDLLDVSTSAHELERLLKAGSFDLLVFEQVVDNLPTLKNPYDVQAVRAMLRPLRAVLRRTETCGLATMHTNKAPTTEFRQKMSMSHQYNALSRSSMLVAQHPDGSGRRVLIGGKANYSVAPTPLSFAIQARELDLNGHRFEVPLACEFREEPELTMDEVLGGPPGKRERQHDERTRAVLLALTPQPQKLDEIAAKADIPRSSVGRYLKDLVEEGQIRQDERGWASHHLGSQANEMVGQRDEPFPEEAA